MNIFKSYLLPALLACYSIAPSSAQVAGNVVSAAANSNFFDDYKITPPDLSKPPLQVSQPTGNSVVLTADVMINVEASSYTAIFSTTQEGTSLESSIQEIDKRINGFLDALKANGIPEENLHVDFISLVPLYDVELVNKTFSNNAEEVESGFVVKKNIHIYFKDLEMLDGIITHAAKRSIYDVVKVDYNIEAIKLAYDTLRSEAQKIIEQKKEIYNRMGLIAQVVNLTEGYDCAYPAQRYSSYTAFHQKKSGVEKVEQNPNLKIRSKEKVKTIYYDRIPYNDFDMVLNSDVAAPMVQFYYQLKVRCNVFPKPQNDENDTASND